MIEFQLLRRFIECLCVHSFSPRRLRAVSHIAGLSFYFFLCLCPWTAAFEQEQRRVNFGVPQALAVVLFCFGSYKQNVFHNILARLRKGRGSGSKSSQDQASDGLGYSVPVGDWFKWVSCPHYLAEIIIYASFCTMLQWHCTSLNLAFCFVLLNLIDGALRTHLWYVKKFDAYPKERKAIIPFLL
mmetsp:Transcript_38871/g.64708  ORF Transcript_38871/g.64708 Transcript_38871/m.64708 type:complete len:185 (+) Transcript_38871:384-938(+)|eukprot:CAMPEP_0184341162 /NCGR_PEP_ID=MMETSP1089-20130417/9789_1 /TAXON_ID=38269 ORGANISM="Gloeochaete wittrockiana, Strain SAG46.84" /NCGR_SAMPLE_ID=MMETSP1089 /ASSEMBLY_ACC=CAM_ASM_000445 /LENGTH=184 /DNA_ID=CAMNT_0026669311 /DNA_START=81 /DNA_END=635 /DNA_ORIENTATION=-